MSQIVLRSYQDASVQKLREGIRTGHRRQILNSATGSGKAVIAAYLLQEAYKKGTKAAIVVDRVSLVDQLSATLDQYGVPHGVTQADHWRRRPHEPIQVCSIQTLTARGFFPGGLDLIIHDEAHVLYAKLKEYLLKTNAVVLGLTATALTKGLADVYSRVVNVVSTNQLIADGWLTPLQTYAAKSPDMTGAKIIAGEWSEGDASDRSLKIVGDVVEEWVAKTRQHLGGPAKTICFSSSVAHGDEICRQFQAIGQRFELVSYLDSDTRRRELIEEFRKPDSAIVGLVSTDALTRGFDVVDIKVGIIARPLRKSLSTHIQMLGRLMRIAPDKEFALVLDHANNTLRFHKDVEEIFENGIHELDYGKWEAKARQEPDEKTKKELTCSVCHYVLLPGTPCCPACGKERTRRSLVENTPGQLVPVEGKSKKPEPPMPAWRGNPDRTWQQLCALGMERKKGNAQDARRWALGQYKTLFDVWPKEPFNPAAPPHIDMDLRSRCVANTIRWAKSRAQRMKDEVRAMNLGKE